MIESAPTILVIDDSAAIRRRLIKLLEPINASFEEAENGQQAWDMITTTRFDVVITDIDMPLMNGIELCRRMRNSEQTRSIPVVVVSAKDITTEERKRLNGHIEAVYQKGSLPTRKFVDKVINVIEESNDKQGQEGKS